MKSGRDDDDWTKFGPVDEDPGHLMVDQNV